MIIATALIALVQIDALRSGSPSPLTIAGTTAAALVENPASAVVNAIRGSLTTLRNIPHLQRENWDLAARNAVLARRNARLEELANAYAQQVVLAPQLRQYARAVEARVIGYPPENAILAVTIDRGTKAGIRRHDGVLAAGGVVGRISQAGPYTSTVRLITDYTSRIPAVVRRGRWWGIARGNLTSVRLQYVSQDAPLRLGDLVVTGDARSFNSGEPIGKIVAVERSDAGLYQTAVLKPAVRLGALDRVVVVSK